MALPIGASINISDKELGLISDFVYKTSGIDLKDKKELVRARLRKRIVFHNFNSYNEYYQHLINDRAGEEVFEMLDAVSTNVTSFFREKQHYDFMASNILPEIVKAKDLQRNKRIRIWSAACSTGEEVYSIVMTLLEYFKEAQGWDIKVLGTDISRKVLSIAEGGIYDQEMIKELPGFYREKYFNKIISPEGEVCFKVKDNIRKLCVFARLNLVNETFPFKGKFDIIFCRNVMIYFDKASQSSLVNKMHYYLGENGYLFIGHSEALLEMKTKFRNLAPAVLQKV